jgi:hypothetical protein
MDKCCGNCDYFKFEDSNGDGMCTFEDYVLNCRCCCEDWKERESEVSE